MSQMTCRSTAIALAAATALAGLPVSAVAGSQDRVPPPLNLQDKEQRQPPAIDVLVAILDGLQQQADREPAWRNPHGSPRPSPDRDFAFPALKGR